MKRAVEILTTAIVWSAVAGYIVWASLLVHRHYETRRVGRMEIRISDSTSNGYFITQERVRTWISRNGLSATGLRPEETDIAAIRRLIARNGFVGRADVYITYSGDLHIDIETRRPLMRLMTEGFDSYVTGEGFVFDAPEGSACHVPIVTGGYRPLFPAGFEGDTGDYADSLRLCAMRACLEIGEERDSLHGMMQQVRDTMRALRRQRTKKRLFESKQEFEERQKQAAAERQAVLRGLDADMRDLRHRVEESDERERIVVARQKKNEENYADFLKLINFVRSVGDDGFWSAEIVQIIVSATSYGGMDLTLVPRSGDFRIEFGETDGAQEKFERLMKFYRDGLGCIGWDRFSTLNLKYDNQVVCTE